MKGRSALPRRAFIVGLAAVIVGIGASLWGRGLLARISYFDVRRVEVVGARWTAPDSLLRLAAIARDRSVWDEYGEVEARLAAHPLIEVADIQRSGWHALRLVVQEVEPLALVGVPELRAVRGDGTILPIDPAGASVDLPLVSVPARLGPDSTRVEGKAVRSALTLFGRLNHLDPGLAALSSDFTLSRDGGLLINLVESQPAERLALPAAIDERLVRRVRATLADLRSRGVEVELVEARFADQIVVRRGQL